MSNQEFTNNEFQIMQDLWKAYKRFYKPSSLSDDKYWDEVLKAFTEVTEKFKTPFCTELAVVFMEDIERRAR